MISIYLFTVLIIILLTKAQAAPPVFCYQCTGLTCEPLAKYLGPCDNLQNRRSIARCYSVAWNMTNIYRGCYEPEDENVQQCIDKRFSNCAICEGNGCNNQPLFQAADQSISCRQCPYGVCDVNSTRQDFHICDRFLMTVVPSCYQIMDYAMTQFTFGCTNALTEEQFEFCSVDVHKLSCRFCYSHNCNNFAHDFHRRGGTRRQCVASVSDSEEHFCDRFTILTPYTHCFGSVHFLRPRLRQSYGCTSDFPALESRYYATAVNYYHCWDTICNANGEIRWQIQESNYRPCIDTSEPTNNITFGALLDSCCVVASFKDENDQIQTFSGCETKINCKLSNSSMCRRCCDDQTSFIREGTPTCNLSPEKFTHQCYRCSGCLLVSNGILANQTQCMASGEKRLCYTFRNATQLYRGCYYETVHRVNRNLLACQRDPKSCTICKGTLCNNQDAIALCYQCSFWNANCRFDQRLVGTLQTCGNFTFANNPEVGVVRPTCYTMTRMDGTMNRGCIDKDPFVCPEGMNCFTCEGLGCNNEGVKFGYCYRCEGISNSTCALGVNSLANASELCPISSHKPLCFSFYDDLLGTIQRGCTVNSIYSTGMKARCDLDTNSTYCSACNFNHCNYFTKQQLQSGCQERGQSCVVLLLLVVRLISM